MTKKKVQEGKEKRSYLSKEFLTRKETADYLGITIQGVAQREKRGELRAYHSNNHIRPVYYKLSELRSSII